MTLPNLWQPVQMDVFWNIPKVKLLELALKQDVSGACHAPPLT